MTDDTTAPDPGLNDPGDDVTSRTAADDLHAPSSELVVRNPYDVEVPETLRERLAYARAMAQAGILPRDYAGKPANVLVAGEMGRELGLSNVQAVLMLNVVEGRPTLGASGVRGVIIRAGHKLKVTARTYSKHGLPTSITVTGWRYDTVRLQDGRYVTPDEPTDTDERTYTIQMAHRAGLVTAKYDDAGELAELRARSQHGKALPWELHTERMLEARATTWLGDTLFADVTMGLAVDREDINPGHVGGNTTVEQVTPSAPAEPTERAAEVLAQTKPARRTDLPEQYDPADDLAVIDHMGGAWWLEAGAQVSRRSKVQLAADRLARWVADNPDQDVVPLPPVDGTLEDEPQPPAADDEPNAVDAEVVPEQPAEQPPTEPVPGEYPDPEVPDPHDGADPWVTDEPAEEVPGDTLATDALPDTTVPDDAPDLEPEAPVHAEEWLALIDGAADQLGKTRTGVMVRWIASHRKNPEDATPAELEAFYRQLEQLLQK